MNESTSGTRPRPRPARPSAGLRSAVLAGACLLAAARGSGSPTGSAAGSSPGPASYQQMVAYSQCMRGHRAPTFRDPAVRGNGVGLNIGAAMNSPQFQAAEYSCQAYAPGLKGGRKQ